MSGDGAATLDQRDDDALVVAATGLEVRAALAVLGRLCLFDLADVGLISLNDLAGAAHGLLRAGERAHGLA